MEKHFPSPPPAPSPPAPLHAAPWTGSPVKNATHLRFPPGPRGAAPSTPGERAGCRGRGLQGPVGAAGLAGPRVLYNSRAAGGEGLPGTEHPPPACAAGGHAAPGRARRPPPCPRTSLGGVPRPPAPCQRCAAAALPAAPSASPRRAAPAAAPSPGARRLAPLRGAGEGGDTHDTDTRRMAQPLLGGGAGAVVGRPPLRSGAMGPAGADPRAGGAERPRRGRAPSSGKGRLLLSPRLTLASTGTGTRREGSAAAVSSLPSPSDRLAPARPPPTVPPEGSRGTPEGSAAAEPPVSARRGRGLRCARGSRLRRPEPPSRAGGGRVKRPGG